MYNLLQHIVDNDMLHAKWLNTLSFMENAGARKISACEHTTDVNLIQLKHAAEEHRHAYYLKKQIAKTNVDTCNTYRTDELIASACTRHYLQQLDIHACRYLKNTFDLRDNELKYAAYLFVTYAIEVRADDLYPIYQQVLDASKSKVMVKSIILEEEGHLEEMIHQIEVFASDWEVHAKKIQDMEQQLFEEWVTAIALEVKHDK